MSEVKHSDAQEAQYVSETDEDQSLKKYGHDK